MKRFLLCLASRTPLAFSAAALATYVCLASAVVAQGAEGRTANETARASTSTESFCAALEKKIRSQSFQFSGWRCKPGPKIRGNETILAWVKMTDRGGKANLELIWLARMQPVVDALVLDALIVPRYGYEPSNVQRAFQIGAV